MKTMKILLPLTIVALLAGCVTGGLSVRAVSDPASEISSESKIFIDPYQDMAIDYRKVFSVAVDAGKNAGLNVTENRAEANFIVRLNFRQGLSYNSSTGQFERTVTVNQMSQSTKYGSPLKDFGIINAGVFPTEGDFRTVWEGSIEVMDTNDPKELKHSLESLFRLLGKDFVGEVPGIEK